MSSISGLGEFLRAFRQGLVETPRSDGEIARAEGARRRKNQDTSVSTPLQTVYKQSPNDSLECYLERLPSEIILKILSFLDASSLFNISFVNKRFHDLANSNVLWSVLYAETEKKKWRPRVSEATRSTPVEERPAGYWKKMLLKEMAGYKDTTWKTQLKHKNPHTGMPASTEDVLRRLHIQWEITLTFRNGHESVYKQTHTFFEDSSVTVCWTRGSWPFMHSLNSLTLHGIVCQPLAPPGDKPRWRSLICKTPLDKSVHWMFLGCDRLVKLLQFGKIIIGVWRGNWKIAFIMTNLHFHKLIEKSLLGSRFCPYIPTEDNALDPDFARHGYTLHILLHNPVRRIMCQRFSPLYSSKAGLQREYVQLNAVDFADLSKHKPVVRISLPWQAEGLQGNVERCCMMTLTVLDEGQRPFWCVSSPVKMFKNQRVVDLEYEGEQFVILYEDAAGKVKMTFVWMEEFQQYFLVQLFTLFSVAKVKRHIGGE